MGKYLTSLLVLASSLLLPDEIFADDQVRRVQEELRKRHLFYADANGEKSPALSLALKRYQEKKGFSPTGAIDSVTLASLGLSTATPKAATTPVAVARSGQVRGANGELLPSSPPLLWPNDEAISKFDPAILGRDYLDLDLADFGRLGLQRRRNSGKGAPLPTGPVNDRSASLRASFDPIADRIRSDTPNPVWTTLVLQPAPELLLEPAEIDQQRTHRAALKPDRRSARRPRRAGPRKEKNPFVLTYHSLDRAFRSLFGDNQSKKKRSAGKRL